MTLTLLFFIFKLCRIFSVSNENIEGFNKKGHQNWIEDDIKCKLASIQGQILNLPHHWFLGTGPPTIDCLEASIFCVLFRTPRNPFQWRKQGLLPLKVQSQFWWFSLVETMLKVCTSDLAPHLFSLVSIYEFIDHDFVTLSKATICTYSGTQKYSSLSVYVLQGNPVEMRA